MKLIDEIAELRVNKEGYDKIVVHGIYSFAYIPISFEVLEVRDEGEFLIFKVKKV